MIGIGPFSFPPQGVAVVLAAILAWFCARFMFSRRLPPDSRRLSAGLVVDALFVGLLVARLGYLALWWQDYAAAPRSIIAIGDGGFLWWLGLLAALALAWWRTRQAAMLRRPVFGAMAVGVLAWSVAGGGMALPLRDTPSLPALSLLQLDGAPASLGAHAGRPLVVNLWATWCPPCRREMPAFAQAQKAFPGVDIILLNQGEGQAEIRAFLEREGLALAHVLRDPSSSAMRALGTRGVPATFFFNADGRLVHAHMGELTQARLKDGIQRYLLDASAAPSGPAMRY